MIKYWKITDITFVTDMIKLCVMSMFFLVVGGSAEIVADVIRVSDADQRSKQARDVSFYAELVYCSVSTKKPKPTI